MGRVSQPWHYLHFRRTKNVSRHCQMSSGGQSLPGWEPLLTGYSMMVILYVKRRKKEKEMDNIQGLWSDSKWKVDELALLSAGLLPIEMWQQISYFVTSLVGLIDFFKLCACITDESNKVIFISNDCLTSFVSRQSMASQCSRLQKDGWIRPGITISPGILSTLGISL